MIISQKRKNQAPIGVHDSRIIKVEYAKDSTGKELHLKSGEKGLEMTFYIPEHDARHKYIFWLNNEQKIKDFCKIANDREIGNTLNVRELINSRLWIVIYSETFYRNGNPILDMHKNPISYLKVSGSFYAYKGGIKPHIDINKFNVCKYMDGLAPIRNEETSSV